MTNPSEPLVQRPLSLGAALMRNAAIAEAQKLLDRQPMFMATRLTADGLLRVAVVRYDGEVVQQDDDVLQGGPLREWIGPRGLMGIYDVQPTLKLATETARRFIAAHPEHRRGEEPSHMPAHHTLLLPLYSLAEGQKTTDVRDLYLRYHAQPPGVRKRRPVMPPTLSDAAAQQSLEWTEPPGTALADACMCLRLVEHMASSEAAVPDMNEYALEIALLGMVAEWGYRVTAEKLGVSPSAIGRQCNHARAGRFLTARVRDLVRKRVREANRRGLDLTDPALDD